MVGRNLLSALSVLRLLNLTGYIYIQIFRNVVCIYLLLTLRVTDIQT